jgi:hypothetical protein
MLCIIATEVLWVNHCGPCCRPGGRWPGPQTCLIGYLSDFERNVRVPLTRAGYQPGVMAVLGEDLDG